MSKGKTWGLGLSKEDVKDWALAHGFREDRWGHLQKSFPDGRRHRMKLSRVGARIETRAGGRWVRLASSYYKNMWIENDILYGFRREGMS